MHDLSSRLPPQAIWRRLAGWLFGALVLLITGFYACRATLGVARPPIRLVIYAFSTQEEVFTQAILPAFEQHWEVEQDADLQIEAVFGAAETLASQINLGAPADLAIFSNSQQVNWLKLGKLIPESALGQVIGSTPLVIVTRPGNPDGIESFADLAAADPGLVLIHPDPRRSGCGEWALLAEHGSAWLDVLDPAAAGSSAADAQLLAIWQHVRLLAPSARAALTLFELGAGDILITYEQDARLAQARGVPIEIVIPESTILAQPLAVLVEDNLTRDERPVALAFLDFLLGTEGQAIFARYHLRPAQGENPAFPPLKDSFQVDDLGGWAQAYQGRVEPLWQTEIITRLELEPATQLLQPGD